MKMKVIPFFLLSCFLSAFIPCGNPGSAGAFTLLEPKTSTLYQPGQIIPVTLDLGEIGGIDRVNFFWYGEHEDMLEELVEEKLALTTSSSNQPPYGGKIAVPRTAIGKIRLLAVAEREDRQFISENWAIFDEIIIQVQPKAQLIEIDFETDKPLRFGRAGSRVVYDQVDFLGKIFELPVVGHFSDGVVRSIRLGITGTTYHSSNETVVTAQGDGLLQLVGNGRTTLTVTNRGKHASLDIFVKVRDKHNEPPVAIPGGDQIVESGTRVKLNALGSYDPEGSSLTYHWSQILGSKVPLLDPFSAKASFLAPFVVEERLFRFKLRVTDTKGADSLPALVEVMVEP